MSDIDREAAARAALAWLMEHDRYCDCFIESGGRHYTGPPECDHYIAKRHFATILARMRRLEAVVEAAKALRGVWGNPKYLPGSAKEVMLKQLQPAVDDLIAWESAALKEADDD